MGNKKQQDKTENKGSISRRIKLTIISSLLVICMCIGIIAEYVNSGIFDAFNSKKDDTIYYENGNLVMNNEIIFSDVKIEDSKLILSNGYVLMENVTVNDDGTVYGKVNPIEK